MIDPDATAIPCDCHLEFPEVGAIQPTPLISRNYFCAGSWPGAVDL